MFWAEEFHKMVYFIIINLFDHSGVWIWNRFRIIFKWKLWRMDLNITVINGMMIEYPHDSWNHRTDFGRRVPGFGVRFWRLAVPLYWWLSWFITIKVVEFIHLYSKACWEEFRATDDAGISFVSNPSTAPANNILSHVERYNNYLESWCISVDGRWRTKIMRALTWSGQCSWTSNYL